MPRKIVKADTYLVSRENAIICKRCGQKHNYTLPMEIDAWAKMVRNFNAIHAACKMPDTVETVPADSK